MRRNRGGGDSRLKSAYGFVICCVLGGKSLDLPHAGMVPLSWDTPQDAMLCLRMLSWDTPQDGTPLCWDGAPKLGHAPGCYAMPQDAKLGHASGWDTPMLGWCP